MSSAAAAADIKVYAEGVRLMTERSKHDRMDPIGWTYQSRMHGNPQALPRKPSEPEDWSECQHGSWFFLPWHRMYLLQLERIIRSLTGEPDWALPYWDYPNANKLEIPAAFLAKKSALFDGSRNLRPLSKPIADETWQRSGTFVALGGGERRDPVHRGEAQGSLESNPHNQVHGRVGGDMAGFQSPLDPLFWIHHCNVDRLWEVWNRDFGGVNPSDPTWLNTSFEFPDPEGRKRWRVEDVKSVEAAGYSYDNLPAAPAAAPQVRMLGEVPTPPRKDDEFELLGATTSGGSVADRVQISAVPRALERRRSLLAAEPGADVAATQLPLFLKLENAGIHSGDASSMWNVYVRAGSGGERHLAGTIAPFGLAGLTQSGGRQTITIDISHLSDELMGGEPVEVTFEPVHDDTEGEPFWERAALYTTAE